MSFDITSVLKDVSVSDTTGREQISYLPLASLDPDPNNFYSLEGIDKLADNIATVGLQQPIRVRPGTETGRYTIISGHRRRAACQLISDGEDRADMFAKGVPCIIEQGEASPALQELRLIYANAATRVMGPAEMSKQAERVEMLLYQLKEEGWDFPGRMRDHVAEACKVSKTKLARLHAIRSNLAPDLLDAYFDAGKLSEATAYAMSQKDPDLQRWIVDHYKATHNNKTDVPEFWVRDFSKDVEAVGKLTCAYNSGNPVCSHQREHVEKIYRAGYRGYDACISYNGRALCCANCENLASCSVSCSRVQKLKERKKADLAARRKSERETAKADRLAEQEQHELDVSEAAIHWARLGDLLQDAGISFKELEEELKKLPGVKACAGHVLYNWKLSGITAEKLLAAEKTDNKDAVIPSPFCFNDDIQAVHMLCRMADLLGVSIDYLLMRTDERKPAAVSGPDTGLQWSTGTPTESGMYETRIGVTDEDTPQTACWQRLEWFDGGWGYPKTHAPLTAGTKVFRWVKLPEV